MKRRARSNDWEACLQDSCSDKRRIKSGDTVNYYILTTFVILLTLHPASGLNLETSRKTHELFARRKSSWDQGILFSRIRDGRYCYNQPVAPPQPS